MDWLIGLAKNCPIQHFGLAYSAPAIWQATYRARPSRMYPWHVQIGFANPRSWIAAANAANSTSPIMGNN